MKPAPANAVLLHGPYNPPPLKAGDRATCRDGEVVVTSWTDAPISWPRCRRIGHKGGSGLLVNEELARAVRSESSAALQHHFGVNFRTVWMWRKALGVGMWDTDGSKRLLQAASERGADVVRGHTQGLSRAERRRRAEDGRRMVERLRAEGRWVTGQPHHHAWPAEDLALLDAGLTDAEVAARTGRSEDAVRAMRNRRRRAGWK